MDYFYKTVEAAQKRAQTLSQQASESAKGFAEQVSTHTKTLAEQAANASSIAAEQAGQKWKELKIQDTLPLGAFDVARQGSSDAGPSEADLEAVGITSGFQDFVRSLTYSTFRDFPLDQVPAAAPPDSNGKVLTPWQERHALLIVQQVKEINELRFVLCPKRMNDAQFWGVYFLLAKKQLPPEAFDPHAPVDRPSEPKDSKASFSDLQNGLQRTLETARETAKTWTSRATGALQPIDASGQLHEMVESHRSGTPRTPASGQNGSKTDVAGDTLKEADIDQDLEAYLRTMSEEKGDGEDAPQDTESASEEAADLDDYLNELEVASNESDADDSEDYLRVSEVSGESHKS